MTVCVCVCPHKTEIKQNQVIQKLNQVKDLLELVCDSSMEKLSMELARASS